MRVAVSTFSVIQRRWLRTNHANLLRVGRRRDQDRDGAAGLDLEADAATPRSYRHGDVPLERELEAGESRLELVLAVHRSPSG
jgi:hypothetical protein